jgi:hypothetical protein
MEKYKQYFKNAHRINDALYKTKVDGVKYIIKYFKLHDSEMFYEAIRENASMIPVPTWSFRTSRILCLI